MGRGRPKKKNPKNRIIQFRVTEEDYQLINAAVKKLDTTKTILLMESFYNMLRHIPSGDAFYINEEWKRLMKGEKA